MSTQPANQRDVHGNIELRLRTIRILWFAMFMSIVLYYVLTFFVGPSANTQPKGMLSITLGVIAVSTTLISFPIKSKLLNRAVAQQQIQLVQQGYIVAFALTEVAALLGLLDFFAAGNRYYYILFLIGAIGQLLHFPQREHVVNALFKNPIL